MVRGLGAVLSNCVVAGCWSYDDGGGVFSGTLNNCVLTGNEAFYGGGAHSSTLNNCTLTGNRACGAHGSAGGGAYGSALTNCILYYNTSCEEGDNHAASLLNYSCTTPDPGSGIGNITNAPLFVDTNGWSNLRVHDKPGWPIGLFSATQQRGRPVRHHELDRHQCAWFESAFLPIARVALSPGVTGVKPMTYGAPVPELSTWALRTDNIHAEREMEACRKERKW